MKAEVNVFCACKYISLMRTNKCLSCTIFISLSGAESLMKPEAHLADQAPTQENCPQSVLHGFNDFPKSQGRLPQLYVEQPVSSFTMTMLCRATKTTLYYPLHWCF